MTPYEILGIAPSASLDEAEAAYHRLLRIHHPDLHQDESADAIAAAELRTRACNVAIEQIRIDERSGPLPAGPATPMSGSRTGTRFAYAPGPGYGYGERRGPADADRTSTPGQPTENAGPTDHRRDADPTRSEPGRADPRPADGRAGAWADAAMHAETTCPLCGQLFVHIDNLTLHAGIAHHIHLDRVPRRSHRLPRFGRLSIWILVPLNAVVAVIIATLSMNLGAPDFAYWVFALCMAPTFIRVVSDQSPF